MGSSSVPRSLASTPPPDEEPLNQGQLINGIGDLFPSLPSRASSLTVGSDCASVITDADEGEDTLVTPKATRMPSTRSYSATPIRTISTRDCIVVQVNPLTPSPSPRCNKRGTSPPSTPKPTKRSRCQAAPTYRGPEERDASGYMRPQVAFHNARQRTVELAGMGILDDLPRVLSNPERYSQVQVGDVADHFDGKSRTPPTKQRSLLMSDRRPNLPG